MAKPGDTGKRSMGQPFDAPPAEIWNNMVSAGYEYARRRLADAGNAEADQNVRVFNDRETDMIKVRNDSGDRAQGEVLGIDGLAVSSLNEEYPWVTGFSPLQNEGWGICKKDIKNGDFGDLQTSGTCIAEIDISDATHTHAVPDWGFHVSVSADEGPLEILYKPAGLGQKTCLVRFVGAGAASGTVPPRIGFVALGHIVDRCFTASVQWIQGPAKHPVTGLALQLNDQVPIYDPLNKWTNLSINSTGFAYWEEARAMPPTHAQRWSVEDASLPIKYIWAKLDECLKKNDPDGTATFDTQSFEWWKRAVYPHVDFPFEFVSPLQGGKYQIYFQNENKLYVGKDTYGLFRLDETGQPSDPYNRVVPKGGSSNTFQWVLVQAENIARRIKGTINWTSGSLTSAHLNITQACDGTDPRPCRPTYRFACPPPCPLEDECFTAEYCPESHAYDIEITSSALMGTPDDFEWVGVANDIIGGGLLVFQGCDLLYPKVTGKAWLCGGMGSSDSASIGTTPATVVTGAYVSNNDWYFPTAQIQVCSAVNGAPIVIEGTICDEDSSS